MSEIKQMYDEIMALLKEGGEQAAEDVIQEAAEAALKMYEIMKAANDVLPAHRRKEMSMEEVGAFRPLRLRGGGEQKRTSGSSFSKK
jgi:flavoprotein